MYVKRCHSACIILPGHRAVKAKEHRLGSLSSRNVFSQSWRLKVQGHKKERKSERHLQTPNDMWYRYRIPLREEESKGSTLLRFLSLDH